MSMLPIETPPVLVGYKEPLTKVTNGFGFYGTIAYDETERHTQCHICGYFFENLHMHIAKKHEQTTREYKLKFGLPITISLRAPKSKSYQWETWHGLDEDKRKKVLDQLNAARDRKMPEKIVGKSLYKKNLEGRCPDQLLDKIMKLKDKLGRAPSQNEFVAEYGSGFLGSIRLTFGTWNEAKRILGLSARPHGGEREYDPETLLDMLRNFQKEKGREPMSSDTKGILPSGNTFRRHFGSFTNAKKEAGVI